jgi:hypothetical protein
MRSQTKGILGPLLSSTPECKGGIMALVIGTAIMAAMFYSARKWPLVDDLLETIVTPLVLFAIMIALSFGQDQSSRLIRKLYLALEKTKVSGQ